MNLWKIWLIVAIALVLRIAIAFLPTVPISDCEWYHQTAISLAQGNGHSYQGKATAYHPPGYSFILALFYYLFGINPLFGHIFNAIIGTLSVVIVFLLGRRLYDAKTGLLSALMLAVYPEHILYSNILSPELVFSAILLLWLLDVTYRMSAVGVVSGVYASAMTYLRSNAIALCFLPFVFSGIKRSRILISVLIVSVALVPWVLRNKKQIGSAVFATNLWVNLWIGNGAYANGTYFDTDETFDDELEAEEYYRSRLLVDIAGEPYRPIKIAPIKLAFFTIPAITASYWGLAGVVSKPIIRVVALGLTIVNIMVLGLFIIALIRRKVPREVAFVWLLFVFTSLLFFGADKFRFPVTPIMIVSVASLFAKEPCQKD